MSGLRPSNLLPKHSLRPHLPGMAGTRFALTSQWHTKGRHISSAVLPVAGGPYHLHYDPKGRCLLATLPQAKQRELAEKLAALRGK
jgi:hypothetical protein